MSIFKRIFSREKLIVETTQTSSAAVKEEKPSVPERIESPLEKAERILGDHFIGPVRIKERLGFDVASDDIPPLPENINLEEIKENGQFLILSLSHDDQGALLNLDWFYKNTSKFTGNKKINSENFEEHRDAPEFTSITPRFGWRLAEACSLPIDDLYNPPNLFGQTKQLREFYQKKNLLTPDIISQSSDAIIDECEEKFAEGGLMKFVQLPIMAYRRNIAEAIYDVLLLREKGTDIEEWTSTPYYDDTGFFKMIVDRDAININTWSPREGYEAIQTRPIHFFFCC